MNNMKSKQVIDQIIKLKSNKIKKGATSDEFLVDFLFKKINNIKKWLQFGKW